MILWSDEDSVTVTEAAQLLREARLALTRVRIVHTNINPDGTENPTCLHCTFRPYPCPTIIALDGEQG